MKPLEAGMQLVGAGAFCPCFHSALTPDPCIVMSCRVSAAMPTFTIRLNPLELGGEHFLPGGCSAGNSAMVMQKELVELHLNASMKPGLTVWCFGST